MIAEFIDINFQAILSLVKLSYSLGEIILTFL